MGNDNLQNKPSSYRARVRYDIEIERAVAFDSATEIAGKRFSVPVQISAIRI